jgi:glutamyl-tRNA synthetase
MTIRVRFAPSPTGYLHVGGARTALYNWLFARHNRGSLVLRIEDTDRARSTEEAIKGILASLEWLGLNCDEGPDRQMDRLEMYAARAGALLASDQAYYCYCTAEELQERRQAALARNEAPRYDRHCRRLTDAERAAYREAGRQPTIRFASSDEGTTVIDDLVRGRVEFDNAQLDDLIIMRPDGIPTYNFAAVVDDADMKITHVVRGEDHLPNTPRQVQIYKALNETVPAFAHLSMILGADKAPLSKRHGAVAVEAFSDEGYLPEALVNFLALLGWAWDDETTIFSASDLIAKFSLEKVNKSPAVFDRDKLDWMNGYYIRHLSVDDLVARLAPFWRRAGLLPEGDIEPALAQKLKEIATICQERLVKLADIVALTDFFFREVEYDPAAVDKVLGKEGAATALTAAKDKLAGIGDWDRGLIEAELRSLAEERQEKPGKLFQPIRVAVSGRSVSPPLFETLEILGREAVLERLAGAASLI